MEIPINVKPGPDIEKGVFIPPDTRPEVELAGYAEPSASPAETPGTGVKNAAFYFDFILRAAIFLAVFLTPLFYAFTTDAINLSKSLLLSILALVMVAAWAAKSIANGEIVWRRVWLVWPALAVGLLALIGTFLSASPWVSFLGDVGRHSFSAASIFAYLIIFIVAVQNLRRSDALWLVVALVASIGLAVLFSFFQFLRVFILPGGFTKISLFTPVGSVFALALIAALTVPVITEFIFKVERRGVRALWGALGVLFLFTVSVVNFRPAWFSLAVVMLFLAVMNYKTAWISRSGRTGRLLLPLAILVLAALFWLVPTIPGPRLTNVPAEISPSWRAGLEVVRGTWSQSLSGALLGSGPEMFPVGYARYKSATLNATNFWGVNFNGANAEVITWLVNQGLLGTLAWIGFVVGFGWLAIRRLRENSRSAIEIGLVASWVFILVSKFFYQTPLVLEFFFWLLPAVFLTTSERWAEWRYRLRTDSRFGTGTFVVLVALLVVSVGGVYLSFQRWFGERFYARALTADYTAENRLERLQEVASSIALNPYEARYWRTLAQVLLDRAGDIIAASQGRQLSAAETIELQNITAQAFQVMQRSQGLDPQNTNLLVALAEGYQRTAGYVAGATDLAISVYERAVELEPVNPFLRTRLAQLYLIRDNFFLNPQLRESDGITKAKRQLEKALDLNPNYSNGRYFMGFVLDREGAREEALKHFRIVAAFNPQNQAIAFIVRNLENGLPALGPPPPPSPETAPVRGGEAEGLPEGQ